ncbi:MAG: glycoside hydrolase family 16 protein [Ilumatobacter sp.]|nr:glycoside hydrolase family 16 protein [Ilumatobacter sp.]
MAMLVAGASAAGCSALGAGAVDEDATNAPTTLPQIGGLRTPVADAHELELVLYEPFDDEELDAIWTTCYWWQVDGGCTISSNDEQQWYRPEAVTVADGSLRLEVTADPQRTTDGDVLPYRSGMISSGHVDHHDIDEPGYAFTYGVVETRIRLPEGDGMWPAVWLLSADRTSLPEIDLLEWYGSRPTMVTSHVHQRIDDERSSARVEITSDEPLGGGWHDVAVDWAPDRVVFYLDGVETGRVVDPELIPHSPMYLIINLAAGGANAGDVDESVLPQTLLVDDVRIWQRGGS